MRRAAPAAPPPPPPAPAAPSIDHGARLEALWGRLEAWAAAAGAPSLGLNPPATEKALKAAEKELGLALPADVRATFRLHDGQSVAAAVFPWLPGCAPLWPIERVAAEHARLQKLAAKQKPKVEPPPLSNNRIKAGVYRAGRIALSDNTFVDLDPAPAGTPGQLVTLINKTDLVLVDTSLTTALERWVNVLERGLWLYSAGTVHPRALAPDAGHPAGFFSKR